MPSSTSSAQSHISSETFHANSETIKRENREKNLKEEEIEWMYYGVYLNSDSVLSRDCCDNSGAVNTTAEASLQVGLDSGASAGVRAGNSQHVRDSHNVVFLLPHCTQIGTPSRRKPSRDGMVELTMRMSWVEHLQLEMGMGVIDHHLLPWITAIICSFCPRSRIYLLLFLFY